MTSRLVSLTLIFLVWQSAAAVPLWEIEGGTYRVTLLGSIHFLRASDYPLPAAVADAVAAADVIVFELDLDDPGMLAAAATMQDLAIDSSGRDLETLLGPAAWRRAEHLAQESGIDLAVFQQWEPWFVAMQIAELRLAQLGFDASQGLEAHVAQRALTAGKEIAGLETLNEQLAALDSLPLDAQRDFLLQTLEDATALGDELNGIIAAWRAGDIAALERDLLADLQDNADLYQRILVARNRDWTSKIEALTRSGEDSLVVVGTLHLVGDDSVIRMLRDAGYHVRRID